MTTDDRPTLGALMTDERRREQLERIGQRLAAMRTGHAPVRAPRHSQETDR